jgi:hypothetical protein
MALKDGRRQGAGEELQRRQTEPDAETQSAGGSVYTCQRLNKRLLSALCCCLA